MTTLILILAVLAAWHFIYEGVIAPSIRMHLRNRLFALRDELRAAKNAGFPAEDEQAFWFVHNGINSFLNRLPALTIRGMAKARHAYESDTKFRNVVENHYKKVQSVQSPVILSVFQRTNEVIGRAFLANAGGWMIYIVPIATCAALMGSLSRATKALLLAPPQIVDRFMPSVRRAHAQ